MLAHNERKQITYHCDKYTNICMAVSFLDTHESSQVIV